MKNPRKKAVPGFILLILLLSTISGLDLSRRAILGEFERDVVEFEMLYSSEKGSWLEEIAPIFEKEYSETHDDNLKLILNPIGSGKGTLQVARGISKPVVWSPASRFWLPTLNYLWLLENDSPIADTDAPALVVSPTVIAIWKSYQLEKNISSMEDLRKLAVEDPNFTYAHTDPSRSNSGFGGVIMQVATALQKSPEEITLEDLALEEVHQWMRELEASAIEYGSSTGFLGKLLVNGGPSLLKAAILYENLVLEKNKGIDQLYNDSLVAVYPKEGTVLNDHPFAILDAPWVDGNEKRVADAFLQFLLRPDIQEKAVLLGFRPGIDNLDPSIEQSIFNQSVGVLPNLDAIEIYNIGNIDAEVLQRIPDLWLATRSIDSSNNEGGGLVWTDYIFPAVLLVLMVVMIGYPIINLARDWYFRRRKL